MCRSTPTRIPRPFLLQQQAAVATKPIANSHAASAPPTIPKRRTDSFEIPVPSSPCLEFTKRAKDATNSRGGQAEETRRNEVDKTTMKIRSTHLDDVIQPETSCNTAPEPTNTDAHDKPKSQFAKQRGCLRSGRFDIAKTRWASSGGHQKPFRHSVSFKESRNTTRFIEAKPTLTRRASTGSRGLDKYYRRSSFSFEKPVESASHNDTKESRGASTGSPLDGSHRWSVPSEEPLSTTRHKDVKPSTRSWASSSAGHRATLARSNVKQRSRWVA
jgi:hypothetical protein